MKIYESKSALGISVTLENGRNRYLSFDQVSSDRCLLYVNEKKLQAAVEAHPYYKKCFDIYYNDEIETVTEKENNSNVATESETDTPVTEDNASVTDTAEQSKETIEFDCLDDAKDYLSESFGISRRSLMSKSACIAQGADHGINVVFND